MGSNMAATNECLLFYSKFVSFVSNEIQAEKHLMQKIRKKNQTLSNESASTSMVV